MEKSSKFKSLGQSKILSYINLEVSHIYIWWKVIPSHWATSSWFQQLRIPQGWLLRVHVCTEILIMCTANCFIVSSVNNSKFITSHLAMFPKYGGLMVQFSRSTEEWLCFAHSLVVNPKFRVVKLGIKILEMSFHRTISWILNHRYLELFGLTHECDRQRTDRHTWR